MKILFSLHTSDQGSDFSHLGCRAIYLGFSSEQPAFKCTWSSHKSTKKRNKESNLTFQELEQISLNILENNIINEAVKTQNESDNNAMYDPDSETDGSESDVIELS